jgi:hypothetical protein
LNFVAVHLLPSEYLSEACMYQCPEKETEQ